jgi:hypothetical protein
MEILLTYIKDGCSYTEALDKTISEGKFKVDIEHISSIEESEDDTKNNEDTIIF